MNLPKILVSVRHGSRREVHCSEPGVKRRRNIPFSLFRKSLIRTREYRPSDAADLATIFYRSVREVACRFYNQAQVEAWAPGIGDPSGWHSRATDGRITVVAVNDADKPIAFGDMERNGHVDLLYSSAEALGTGAASAIYNRLELEAIHLGLTRLYVEASECALPFFERKKFIKVRRNDFEIRGVPIHNYTMEKFLQGRHSHLEPQGSA
jgi:putative acetyltransferase